MNKFFKIFLPIIFILFLVLIVWIYWWNFWTRPISDNPENWGQFWDYIWWLLNPLIGLVNLWAIIYFWYYWFIKDKENSRKQVMPLPFLEVIQNYNSNWGLEDIWIKLKNCGFWPMIVNNLTVTWPDNQKYPSYQEILKNFPQAIIASIYHNWQEWIIDKWEVRFIMKIEHTANDYIKQEWFNYLKQFSLKINYKDIFNEDHVLENTAEILFDGIEYFWKS